MSNKRLVSSIFKALDRVHSTLEKEACQESIIQSAITLFGAKGAGLMLFNRSDKSLTVRKVAGLSQAYLEKDPLESVRDMGEAAELKAVVARVGSDLGDQYREALEKEGIKYIVGLSFSAGNTLTGILRLYLGRGAPPDSESLRVMEGFTRQAGLALRKCFFISSLQDFTSEIDSRPAPYSIEQTVKLLLATAAKVAQAKGCVLWLLDRDTGNLEPVGSVGLSPDYLDKGPISAQRSLGEAVKGLPVVISRVEDEVGVQYPAQAAREGIKAIIGLPVRIGSRLVGGLRFYYEFEFEPDGDELTWMGHLTRGVGMALEKDRLLIRLKKGHDRYQDLIDNLEAKFSR